MTNTPGYYNVEYYARKALSWLKNKKGMSRLVNREIEGERNASWEQGKVVNLRRPTNFAAASVHVPGTGTTAEDLKGQNVQITLDQWYEKKFAVTDDQIAHGGEKLVREHIGPAVDRVLDAIENSIFALGAKVGPVTDISGASGAEDQIVDPLTTLENNLCPVDDGNVFYAVDPSLAALFQKDPIFHAANIAGQGRNEEALVRGMLGERFGANIFRSQLAKRLISQQSATLALAAGTGDRVGALTADYDVNTSSGIAIDGLTDTQTLSVNVDTFTIAGDPTVYVVTAVSGAVTSNTVTISCFPALRQAHLNNDVVTFTKRKTIQDAAAGTIENLMFHKDAFALVMAPLPMDGNGAGAEVFTAVDDETGLAIRVRRFYDGDTAKLSMAVDALWGVDVLNGQLATRVIRAQS